MADGQSHLQNSTMRNRWSDSINRRVSAGLAGIVLLACAMGLGAAQWSSEKANEWYSNRPWMAGCNYSPSTAINQLEMWQPETFDPATIDRELGWAEQLGFNTVRVFLHNLLWTQDAEGFLGRMDKFLAIADKHHIGVIFVPLDAVWDPNPHLGKQHDPVPHVHNSGWVQSPGAEILKSPARQDELKPYIQGVIGRFKNDPRVAAWDIFNEPDNPNVPAYVKQELTNKADMALLLLKKSFVWAREVNPSQPLTAGVWERGRWGATDRLLPMEKFIFDNSDIISFHNYDGLEELKRCVQDLRRFNRPILCTEYMARPHGSRFDPNFGYLKEQKVGAINWGFVNGKTQTIYPWDSWTKTYTAEPPVWFHDIFRQDGTPFDVKEVAYIKAVTGKTAEKASK
ncbi:MAG TPA: cellulase family glycosylhydrolase [Verrucomicrobiae bacterium]|nr:cellulase family glycosylhydrolase [Verrucomicrobiae bacterium]